MSNNTSKSKKYFPVCLHKDLELTGCKEFVLYQNQRPYFGFVVKEKESVYAYANTCPHQGRMLQWKTDTFLTKDKSRIMCAAHGATFEIRSGLCVGGPCLGQTLKVLGCYTENDVVLVSLE